MEGTIAAVSTAPGEGGIGIIRMSGEKAEEILAGLFVNSRSHNKRGAEERSTARDLFEGRRMRHGWIVDPVSNETIDEALCVVMRGPHSYTGEDVAEIQCHGGPVPLRRILRACYALGAAPAEPGEFTKRAFLNGRMDLVQAGAVIDLIGSRTELAYRAARELAEGKLSGKIREAREYLLAALAEMAARIDYPEAFDVHGSRGEPGGADGEAGGAAVEAFDVHGSRVEPGMTDGEPGMTDALLRRASGILDGLIDGADRGKLLRDGLRACIIGKPNVGKSSLYNALLRADAAIVAAEPGTTRDTLETWLELGGAAVALTDTAGIREDAGAVERAGILRAKEAYARADVCLFVLDGSAPAGDEDLRIAGSLDGSKPTIIVVNKNDLPPVVSDEAASSLAPFAIGLVHTILAEPDEAGADAADAADTGVSLIEELLTGLVTEGRMPSEQYLLVTREAHKAALEDAAAEIREGCAALEAGEPPELAEVTVREAYRILGEMIGEEVSDDVINRVFDGFCVGK
ncbi:MAG: tRNA modification GTPase [Clostridiales Family XIII bacterium]|jgi:tRNA modification GTPase|nr:tRNA modification GTPase [Clostridiales Family XIII bacterium]